jgi:hypothetical protein
LHSLPIGLNASLWIAALCASAVTLRRIVQLSFPRAASTRWLVLASAFGALLSWRASPVLQGLDIGAVALCLALASFDEPSGRPRMGLARYAWRLCQSAAAWLAGAVVVCVEEVDWRRVLTGNSRSIALAVGRGIAIAVPIIVVFTALLANADVFFSRFLSRLVVVAPGNLASHFGLFVMLACLSASYLWDTLLREPLPSPVLASPNRFTLGRLEVAIVLGAINVLFLVFVLIQFRYLFGGVGRVEASASLTYAEYARRGFFELLAVAAFVLPILLTVHWLLPTGRKLDARWFAVLGGGVVALIFVIIASALERMRIYIATYGLTELRLYSTAFLFWMGLTLLWLCVTVLRGHRDRFPFGAIVAAFSVIVVLNAANPDALIVRRNAAVADHRPFDIAYAMGLSADAMPQLVRTLRNLPENQRCATASAMSGRTGSPNDWRSWNWSRHRSHTVFERWRAVEPGCR